MKKTRIVQIIREEIAKVLKEGSMQARELADRNSLQQLQAMYDQLMIDMEQEAEPEGGPIADQYADQMQDIEDAMQIKRGGSGEMTYGDMLHKNYPDKYGPGGVELNEMAVNEMATFYKVKGDKAEAKAALKKEKEKYKEGTALYNTLDTLEKKGEIDYKELSKETGKDVASYNNPKSRGVLEKDLADFIEAEKVKRGPKADPNKPKKEKKDKSGKTTTPKSKKKSTVSKLEKKYYVDPEDGGPTNKELRDLAASGLGDESLSKLQTKKEKKCLKQL